MIYYPKLAPIKNKDILDISHHYRNSSEKIKIFNALN